MSGVYVLGGYQSDFALNCQRQGKRIFDLFESTVLAGLESTQLDAAEIDVGHVGNFAAPLFTGQSHLGGFFGHVSSGMANLPASSHEAACASGSMALLAAMAGIEAGFYDTACVVGVELMRNVSGVEAANNLRAAAWVDKEWQDTDFVWPAAFSDMFAQYEQHYQLDKQYLAAISQKNYGNARLNPNAQSRQWQFAEGAFGESDELNPVVHGNIRRQDCGQVTDGAAVVFLASAKKAKEYARRHNLDFESIPRIKGWGHINAPMLFEEKLKYSQAGNDESNAQKAYLFPHVNSLFQQTLKRAGLPSIGLIDGLEVHDCFNVTEYMILDHSGLLPPGQAWQAIEDGVTNVTGSLPINASGGLIGLGHPVGATGVRMLLDAYKQSSGTAGDYQIVDANNMMTFNLGGSTTSCVSFVLGR